MDKHIYEFLKILKFDDSEINLLKDIAPTLNETSSQIIIDNISLVVDAGYPADDLTFLISQNPAFLCRNTLELKSDIKKLLNSNEDLETLLKNNPDLI